MANSLQLAAARVVWLAVLMAAISLGVVICQRGGGDADHWRDAIPWTLGCCCCCCCCCCFKNVAPLSVTSLMLHTSDSCIHASVPCGGTGIEITNN